TLPIIETRLDHKQGCCTAADAEDARRGGGELGISFYSPDLRDEFARVIGFFVDENTAARTPNPCVLWHNWVKFGKLFGCSDGVGAQCVATGHYARKEWPVGGGQWAGRAEEGSGVRNQESDGAGAVPALLRGLDERKDQSYVLFGVSRSYLPRM